MIYEHVTAISSCARLLAPGPCLRAHCWMQAGKITAHFWIPQWLIISARLQPWPRHYDLESTSAGYRWSGASLGLCQPGFLEPLLHWKHQMRSAAVVRERCTSLLIGSPVERCGLCRVNWLTAESVWKQNWSGEIHGGHFVQDVWSVPKPISWDLVAQRHAKSAYLHFCNAVSKEKE